ncbi:hypothetical protein BDE36_2470 [Arcticibacter tournemirensis]|uniref:Molybdopterin-guanine dinucleotide biosynthesis protein MobB n=1 Tax=Arcticibacter tournemirensis TaxID=699437 RepID=A0A5M9GVC3_9SPHI|nr:DUF5712 family protein [Arcticibacter tournemirensis]KAA8478260.1 molybdopterin-guanine dinucleotide biosynthesis protein MobB [Arcticibacter tournemirensis]TQM50712.1 hypothetical protein BDE36_2470 [Arcticibacter tournemirensis]
MHINITDSEEGTNKGSSSQLVHYLEKENRVRPKYGEEDPEYWFNQERRDVPSYEVRIALDNNVAKLSKTDAKFFLINISPSRKELAFLKERYGEAQIKEKLKEYSISVMDEYARNFKRPGVESSKDLLWFGKVEEHRYYSHKDSEVKQGVKKRGELKEGDQWHVQVVVSRKDITNRIKLSPMNKSRGRNQKHSLRIGQFDRKAFAASGERIFDEKFGFERGLTESFLYTNTMKNGTVEQRLLMRKGRGINTENTIYSHQLSPEHEPVKESLLDSLLLKPEPDYSPAVFRRKKKRRRNDQGLRL